MHQRALSTAKPSTMPPRAPTPRAPTATSALWAAGGTLPRLPLGQLIVAGEPLFHEQGNSGYEGGEWGDPPHLKVVHLLLAEVHPLLQGLRKLLIFYFFAPPRFLWAHVLPL